MRTKHLRPTVGIHLLSPSSCAWSDKSYPTHPTICLQVCFKSWLKLRQKSQKAISLFSSADANGPTLQRCSKHQASSRKISKPKIWVETGEPAEAVRPACKEVYGERRKIPPAGFFYARLQGGDIWFPFEPERKCWLLTIFLAAESASDRYQKSVCCQGVKSAEIGVFT